MAVKDIFKVSVKTFVNPSGWLGVSDIKKNTHAIVNLVKGLFVVPTPQLSETFDEAMARFNLTPEDIKEREKDYLFYTGIFLLLSVSLFCFGFYLLIVDRTFAGCLLGIATSALFASQAFRYHFWYFQIVQRRLGCTFAEWQQFVIGRLPGPKT